jgi:AAA15 family ATPase/GTPase
MLRKIKIENFRGFQSFELNNLGRLNLLVGTNNSGKTSILEAIQLLCSYNNLEPLIDITNIRGEYFWNEQTEERELDISHLFFGHKTGTNAFSVIGTHEDDSEEKLSTLLFTGVANDFDTAYSEMHKQTNKIFDEELEINLSKIRELLSQWEHIDENFDKDLKLSKLLKLLFMWEHGEEKVIVHFPMSNNGGLPERSAYHRTNKTKTKNQFVTSSALTSERAIELFDRIVLTPEENLVQEALKTIEPKIERIASVGSERYRRSQSRGGFLVRLSGSERPVPIGSMGDGIWRMLGLTLAAVGAENGFLFIDEIDTGLHFSTMSDMWKLVWETAKRLNIQVFATTHSNDCWNSLASIASREDIAGDGITIQRIERDKSVGIVFNEREIVVAADRGIEVR